MEPSRYPRVDAIIRGPAVVELAVQDQGVRFIQEATIDAALSRSYVYVSTIASNLRRPVYVHVTDAQGGNRVMVVYPNGFVEPENMVFSQAAVAAPAVEKKPFYKRAVFLVPLALVLVVGLLGGGMWGVIFFFSNHGERTVSAQPHKTSTDPQSPDSTQEKKGDTVQLAGAAEVSAVSQDGKYVTYLSGKTLYVVSAQTGEEISKTEVKEPDSALSELTIRPHQGGFAYVGKESYLTWSSDKKFSEVLRYSAKDQQMLTRQGVTALVNRDNPSKPAKVTLLGSSPKEFRTPAEGASFISTDGSRAYWATSQDGGTVVTADASGKVEGSHKLASPGEGARLTSWAGVSSRGEVMTLWSVDGRSTLVFQSVSSGDTAAKVSVDASEGAKVDFSGSTLLLGKQIIDCNTRSTYTIEMVPEKATPLPVGFHLSGGTGGVSWAGPGGVRKSPEGEVLGVNHDGASVLLSADHHHMTIIKKDGE